VLARVDRLFDLSWLRGEIADCYCLDDGRHGIDPEVAVRLMLAGILIGIVYDRKLMREAQVNIAFKRTVEACLKAKIATAEVVHIDASLIRANVSWESLV
jgi:transposase